MFAPGRLFQLRIMIVSKARANLNATLSGALLKGKPLAIPTNTRLGFTGLPETNTLACYEHP
jgi:hypothetical protein